MNKSNREQSRSSMFDLNTYFINKKCKFKLNNFVPEQGDFLLGNDQK